MALSIGVADQFLFACTGAPQSDGADALPPGSGWPDLNLVKNGIALDGEKQQKSLSPHLSPCFW
jgi:hypothetical protein